MYLHEADLNGHKNPEDNNLRAQLSNSGLEITISHDSLYYIWVVNFEKNCDNRVDLNKIVFISL